MVQIKDCMLVLLISLVSLISQISCTEYPFSYNESVRNYAVVYINGDPGIGYLTYEAMSSNMSVKIMNETGLLEYLWGKKDVYYPDYSFLYGKYIIKSSISIQVPQIVILVENNGVGGDTIYITGNFITSQNIFTSPIAIFIYFILGILFLLGVILLYFKISEHKVRPGYDLL